ncbi:hypothetical protein JCM10020v2_005895 [Rhodotorula toruloides]
MLEEELEDVGGDVVCSGQGKGGVVVLHGTSTSGPPLPPLSASTVFVVVHLIVVLAVVHLVVALLVVAALVAASFIADVFVVAVVSAQRGGQ